VEVPEPLFDYQGHKEDLLIYVVLYPASIRLLKERLQKVCDSFMGTKFQIPATKQEIQQALKKAKREKDDVFNTLNVTLEQFKKYLQGLNSDKRVGHFYF